ncbi:thioredoxin domain-containing protein [Hirschia baltica]|uniref:DsbA oxidoreductase n=1 Tax=Hirschia baltica (strain ATCC 49814 / DSM 5838 / IFAM 1418) TaxID=582402 RepID=C6XRC3_HIRBI|nr:thioredoxin domain-containing protein [Hirschia baltica]ACT58755.1 DsbA oxidoreductase [Hirschia baltica ATCC 49814]
MRTKHLLSAIAIAALTVGCSQADSKPVAANDVKGSSVSYVAGDVILGNADAKVQIVEYASTACGHCRTFHKTILPNIKKDFIENGSVSLIYRDLPTPPAQLAAAGAALARCAGKDEYYKVLDDVFTSQGEIFDAARSAGGALPAYNEIGARHGMSEETVKACVTSTEVLNEISRTSDLAQAAGVTSTPTLFIDGVKVEAKDMSNEGIAALLNDALGIETTSESAPAEPEEAAEAAH